MIDTKLVDPNLVLQYAISKSLVDSVKYSLNNQANVNGTIYDDEKTFLNLALEAGNLQVIDLLLKAGADPKIDMCLTQLLSWNIILVLLAR